MEAAGLAIGVFPIILNVIQLAEKVTQSYRQIKDSSPQIAELIHELNSLQPVLLSVRDLIERQATDDADIRTLSSLTSSSRSLEEILKDLETSSPRLIRHSSKRSKLSRVFFSKEHKTTIERIHEYRSTLGVLIQFNDLKQSNNFRIQINTDHLNLSGLDKVQQAIEIGRSLDESGFSKTLGNLTTQNEPGIGEWLLKSSKFLEWEKCRGKKLWCNGLRKLMDFFPNLPEKIQQVHLLTTNFTTSGHWEDLSLVRNHPIQHYALFCALASLF